MNTQLRFYDDGKTKYSFNENDIRKALSEITSAQMKYKKSGMNGTEARRLAVEEYCEDRELLTPDLFNSIVGRWMADLSTITRANKPKVVEQKSEDAKKEVQIKKEKDIPTGDLYRYWADNNDVIPSDKLLAHFTKMTSPAFYHHREVLIEEGYVFEKLKDNSWKVVERPNDKRFEELMKLAKELGYKVTK